MSGISLTTKGGTTVKGEGGKRGNFIGKGHISRRGNNRGGGPVGY